MNQASFLEISQKTLCIIEDSILKVDTEGVLDIEFQGPDILQIQSSQDQKTYVININTSNKQIWLSSPVSGPDKFSYKNHKWISEKTNLCLSNVLNKELKSYIKSIQLPSLFE